MNSVAAAVRTRPALRDPTYLRLALLMSAMVALGFGYTYFLPMLTGVHQPVSVAVHVHGWSFFLWYALLPVQAWLVLQRRMDLHRTLGGASLALAIVMVATGLLVVGVRVDRAIAGEGSDFWIAFGPAVFSTLLLFAAFYGGALWMRRQPGWHRRLMILASAGGLGAATFRVLMIAFGPQAWIAPVGILLPNLVVLAAMWHDHRTEGRVHPVYRWGLVNSLLLEGFSIAAAQAPWGPAYRELLALVGRAFGALY